MLWGRKERKKGDGVLIKGVCPGTMNSAAGVNAEVPAQTPTASHWPVPGIGQAANGQLQTRSVGCPQASCQSSLTPAPLLPWREENDQVVFLSSRRMGAATTTLCACTAPSPGPHLLPAQRLMCQKVSAGTSKSSKASGMEGPPLSGPQLGSKSAAAKASELTPGFPLGMAVMT